MEWDHMAVSQEPAPAAQDKRHPPQEMQTFRTAAKQEEPNNQEEPARAQATVDTTATPSKDHKKPLNKDTDEIKTVATVHHPLKK